MQVKINEHEFKEATINQLQFFSPIGKELWEDFELWEDTFRKIRHCLAGMEKFPACLDGQDVRSFSLLHGDLRTIALYCLANTMHRLERHERAKSAAYLLNKMLHGLDLIYDVEMPTVWGCGHPVGSVIGRAVIGEQFFFVHGCCVGQSMTHYPVIGHHVRMYGQSAILGDSRVGNHVRVSYGTIIKNQEVPDNVLVFGQSPNLSFRPHDAKTIDDAEWLAARMGVEL